MTNKLGIENLKSIFSFILYISYQLAGMLQSFNFSKAIQLAFYIAENKELLKKAKPALAELKDLNQEEVQELTEYFDINFDLANDTLESRIEKGIDFIPEGYTLLKQNISFYIRIKDWIQSWGAAEQVLTNIEVPEEYELAA